MSAAPLAERLHKKANITPDGCWLYSGAVKPSGYAEMGWQGRTEAVHRLSYKEFVGPIPAGLEIDHLCRNRSCFNPDHLEAVTHQVNIRRGHEGRRYGQLLNRLPVIEFEDGAA